jgi:hypothetical protein
MGQTICATPRRYDDATIRRVWMIRDTLAVLGYVPRNDLVRVTAERCGMGITTVQYILTQYSRPVEEAKT